MPRLRTALALLSMALAVPFVASCGDIGTGNDPTHAGETEGVYVTTGGLRYQVQMSRKLNPYDVEDMDYLTGIPDAAGQVANKKYAWFGVFMRVENRTNKTDAKPQVFGTASKFEIEDNEGELAEPVSMPIENIYAYRPVLLKPGGILPNPSSTAAQAPIGGALILFKVPQILLERRPVLLKIFPRGPGEVADVRLDI